MRPQDLRLGPSAGWCKSLAQMQQIAATSATDVTIGAITREQREGNSGNVFAELDRGGYLNSLGMPNSGEIDLPLSELVTLAKKSGKKTSINVAGFSPQEYAELAWYANSRRIDTCELNLGCPNVWGDGGQKPIPSFRPEMIQHILSAVGTRTPSSYPLALKLSPYSDPSLLGEVAACINEKANTGNWKSRPLSVVLSNTFPNAFAFQEKSLKPIISYGKGLAGFSGGAYKYIVLGQVLQFRELLDKRIGITAAGGIQCGRDVLEYETVGADQFQVGGRFIYPQDFGLFGDIITEYANLVDEDGKPI